MSKGKSKELLSKGYMRLQGKQNARYFKPELVKAVWDLLKVGEKWSEIIGQLDIKSTDFYFIKNWLYRTQEPIEFKMQYPTNVKQKYNRFGITTCDVCGKLTSIDNNHYCVEVVGNEVSQTFELACKLRRNGSRALRCGGFKALHFQFNTNV